MGWPDPESAFGGFHPNSGTAHRISPGVVAVAPDPGLVAFFPLVLPARRSRGDGAQAGAVTGYVRLDPGIRCCCTGRLRRSGELPHPGDGAASALRPGAVRAFPGRQCVAEGTEAPADQLAGLPLPWAPLDNRSGRAQPDRAGPPVALKATAADEPAARLRLLRSARVRRAWPGPSRPLPSRPRRAPGWSSIGAGTHRPPIRWPESVPATAGVIAAATATPAASWRPDPGRWRTGHRAPGGEANSTSHVKCSVTHVSRRLRALPSSTERMREMVRRPSTLD